MIASYRLYLALTLVVIVFCLSGLYFPLATVGSFLNAILILLLVVDYSSTARPESINCERFVEERLSIGRSNLVEILVTNNATTTVTGLVKDDSPQSMATDVNTMKFSVEPGMQFSLKYQLFPSRRGQYAFGNIYVRYLSRFGLFWRQVIFAKPANFKVYSDLQNLRELSIRLSTITELGELHRSKRGQGTEFSSLKEYVSGDDANTIDWKATARRDRPVIRTYESEQEQRLVLLIDAGRMMFSKLDGLSRFDHALNAALALALTGLSYHDQVGIGIFADKPLLYLPCRRGKNQLTKILDATFAIEPKMVEPDYSMVLSHFASLQKGRSLIVLITDLSDPSGSQPLLAGLAKLSHHHLALCVTLKSKEVEQLSRPFNPDQFQDPTNQIFRRAIAIDLISQKELALNILERQGCLVVDQPPNELSESLINRYLEIKRKGLL